MAFEILNEATSVVYVLAGDNRYPQAEVDAVDLDILVQGVNGEGVVSGAVVTPQGIPDATVAVAAAVVRIAGTDVAFAGGNVNCGAAAAALPRFDLIAINNAGVASAVNGAAAAVPVFPAVPANSVIVAAVWRAANDNTITAADIVDKRCLLLGDALGTAPTLLGIVGGIATPNRSHHTLSAQAGAADDLDGMTFATIISNGEIVIIRPDAGDTITVKHNALGGADARNILCIGNADIVLDDDHDFAICIYSTAIGAGSWMVLGGGAAGGGGTLDDAYDFGGAGAGRTINATDGSVLITNADQDAGVPNLELARAVADVAEPVFGIRATGDAQFRFMGDANGRMQWGGGAGAQDIVLSRAAPNHLLLATGDVLRLQNIADVAGTILLTTSAAAPHVTLGGIPAAGGSVRINDRLGIAGAAPAASTLFLSPTSATTHIVIQLFPTVTTGAFGSLTGLQAIASHRGTAGSTNLQTFGMNFQADVTNVVGGVAAWTQATGALAFIRGITSATVTATNVYCFRTQMRLQDVFGGTVTFTDAWGIYLEAPSFIGAGATIPGTYTGVKVLAGALAAATNFIGVDIDAASSCPGFMLGLRNADRTAFTPSAAQNIVAAATAILANATIVQLAADNSYTLTAVPTIADGQDGQVVIIVNVDAVDTITIQDQGTLGGSNLRLGAATRALAPRDNIVLMFNSTIGDWVEVVFNNVI